MCDNETPDLKESGTDRECIDAIPRRASVVGIDTEGRAHLSSIYGELEIWVLNEAGTEVVHYANGGDRELSEWVAFVAERCGWDVRHRVELPAGAGLLDDEDLPPTRAEVLNA